MVSNEKKRYQRKIGRLQREIQHIDAVIYGVSDDPRLQYTLLERKRDDVIRGTVLQLHTAIENLLDIWLKSELLGVPVAMRGRAAKQRRVASRALDELLQGGRSIGFDSKLRLLQGLGKLRQPAHLKLVELNRLRNKCSHNWLLNERIRKGIKPRLAKRPLLQFKGRNLYDIDTVSEFASEYWHLYLQLFGWVYT